MWVRYYTTVKHHTQYMFVLYIFHSRIVILYLLEKNFLTYHDFPFNCGPWPFNRDSIVGMAGFFFFLSFLLGLVCSPGNTKGRRSFFWSRFPSRQCPNNPRQKGVIGKRCCCRIDKWPIIQTLKTWKRIQRNYVAP